MPELITAETVGEMLDELRIAFRTRIAEKDLAPTARAWTEALTGLTVEAVRTASRRHIQTGEHFPRVKEIRELALDFMARTSATMPSRGAWRNPFACPICGAEPEPVTRMRDGEEMQVRSEVFHDRAAHHVVDSFTG